MYRVPGIESHIDRRMHGEVQFVATAVAAAARYCSYCLLPSCVLPSSLRGKSKACRGALVPPCKPRCRSDLFGARADLARSPLPPRRTGTSPDDSTRITSDCMVYKEGSLINSQPTEGVLWMEFGAASPSYGNSAETSSTIFSCLPAGK